MFFFHFEERFRTNRFLLFSFRSDSSGKCFLIMVDPADTEAAEAAYQQVKSKRFELAIPLTNILYIKLFTFVC